MTELAKKVNLKHPISVDHVDIRNDLFHPGAYVISLPLDAYPSYAWQTLFDLELWGSLDFWDRKVLIVGDQLKLVTTLNNLQDKLDWLDHIVVATNKRVDEHNRDVKAEKESKELGIADQTAIRNELAKWLVRRLTG
ncbi:hypothetical protein MUP79_09370 [Candidatus Bathyarchaeota archaeon]|nr:hypothetical protein [Candidatus Bathyarchaeota archaeon]